MNDFKNLLKKNGWSVNDFCFWSLGFFLVFDLFLFLVFDFGGGMVSPSGVIFLCAGIFFYARLFLFVIFVRVRLSACFWGVLLDGGSHGVYF